MHDIIRIDHLSKRFGEVQAVQDLSFRVKEGELFAFLGVNGAGKSTTINILCGQLAKDGGSVEIDGADPDRDPDRVRRELGVVFQNSVLDGALSVRDNLQSRAALYGIRGAAFAKRLAELAQLLHVAARRALVPQLLAAPAPEPRGPRLDGEADRLRAHPSDHEDLAGVVLLNDAGDEAPLVELQIIDSHIGSFPAGGGTCGRGAPPATRAAGTWGASDYAGCTDTGGVSSDEERLRRREAPPATQGLSGARGRPGPEGDDTPSTPSPA